MKNEDISSMWFWCRFINGIKMTIQKALKQLGIECEVENTDINSARGADCDCIFTSQELLNELKGTCNVDVYPVKKYMDLAEVTEVVQTF